MRRREGQAVREQETGPRVKRQAWSSLPADKAQRCCSARQGRAGTRLPPAERAARKGRMESPGQQQLLASAPASDAALLRRLP